VESFSGEGNGQEHRGSCVLSFFDTFRTFNGADIPVISHSKV